jgi:WhiB family redox-sensing transcriptional regulator
MVEDLSWMDDALCREVGGDLHFPGPRESAAPARRICAACSVKTRCAVFALENDYKIGVWGGLTGQERRRLRRSGRSTWPKLNETAAA